MTDDTYIDEQEWWERGYKNTNLDLESPSITARRMKRKYPLRFDDMVDEARDMMEEMTKEEE